MSSGMPLKYTRGVDPFKSIVIDLFSNSNMIEMELEEELIDLQTNEELRTDIILSGCKNKYLTSIPVYGEW
ncbi:hypothetical protein T08_14410 [Trichinella sp. T8]|nr:hypothetical protein T08_14410 [Trichinella sp. T8]